MPRPRGPMTLPPFEQVLGLFVCGVAGAGAAYFKLALDLEALRASTRRALRVQQTELEARSASTHAEVERVLQAGSNVERLRAEWATERGRIQRCERDANDALRAATECKVQQAEWGSEVNEALDVSQRSASETATHRVHTQALVRGAIRASRVSMQEVMDEMQRCMDKTEQCRQQVGDMMRYTQTMQLDNERMKGELVDIANQVLRGMGEPSEPVSSHYKLLK
jgi:hypothetical protein